jgi:Sap-like sulfolipid-1-addressing protein
VSSALASVVLLGLACAANPWGIMIAILLLDARRGHGVVWTYVLAWSGSISVVIAALLAGLGAVFASGSDSANTAVSWILLVLGVVLLGFGVRRLLSPQGEAAPAETPRWLQAIENISYPAAFVLGIYSATYPMVIAAAGEILRADTTTGETAALAALFVVLGSSSVVAVAALGTFAPRRSAAFLDRMRAWVTAHNRAVITAILLVLGVFLAARGLGGLL